MGDRGVRPPASERLSPREAKCLRLVLELRSAKAIADQLGLSPGTVETYLKRAVRKLGVSDRITAARLFREIETSCNAVLDTGTSPNSGLPSPADPADPNPAGAGKGEPVEQSLREECSRFEGPDPPPKPLFWRLFEPLRRPEGGQNDLSTPERLVLCIRYGALVLIAFSVFCVALLTATAVRRVILTIDP